MIKDNKAMALLLVNCIVMEHPDATTAMEGLDRNARTWSRILSYSNVNLEVARGRFQMYLDGDIFEMGENGGRLI